MALPRYSVVDAYILEELRQDYEAAEPRGRIRILKKLQKGDRPLPFEVAALAVHDPTSQVRQWFARYGNYGVGVEREPWEGTKDLWEKQRGAWNLLIDTLKNDADPFVRACLRENPAAFGLFDWDSHFLHATYMERLALMRNPKVGKKLIEKIFDPQENELGIDMHARRELCRAFLTNKAALHELTDDAGLCPDHKGYWEAEIDARQFLATLWRLAAKWPEDSDIPALIFNEVPANGLTSGVDEHGNIKYVKAETYRVGPRWRLCILYSCGPRDDEVVRLGLQDSDEECRKVAYSKLSWVPPAWVPELITRRDKAALEGLVQNESLSLGDLQKCQKCLDEIKPHGYPMSWITIERKQKATLTQEPERLFGKDGRRLLEEKINFIGRTVAEARAGNQGLTGKVDSALLWARVAATAAASSVLVLLYLIFK